MAYSEQLDRRITASVGRWGAERRKMFGGTCHLIGGNMMCGVMIPGGGLTDQTLAEWLGKARAFAASLPPK